ncbi:hypothetical protein [Chitinophaga sp. sic0106]|uniref:hypothetical protein n=1 Tax=Chitinophaga sp. sic0106 TaxID=2854785 RepID=UPI001C43FD3A|nr:hypothetical protein [Chitinophaga sp. sic0106]MBV7530646.1 hypothetical protein [Chitinophaga sp. sic0106]
MKQQIYRIASSTSIWPFAVPMVILFLVMSFLLIPPLQVLLGSMQLPDTRFNGYDAGYVQQLAERLQSSGIKGYLRLEWYADIPFIILYVITFTLGIAKLLMKNGLWNSVWYYSLCFPVLAGIFDLAENAGIIYMLQTNRIAAVAPVASFFTIAKGCFLPLTLLTLVVLLGIAAYRKIAGRFS